MGPLCSIAHYRISEKLGQGGMGEVYRATDTRLGRDVAVKILPERFARDPDHMARFRREAQMLASLNHPNIASIYGVEEHALVMELVEGEDLRGPLPLAIALDYACQIATALETAHEKGIIHRDLKPANIKITRDGRVKLLDFGLAKAMEGDAAAPNPADSPTLTLAATRAGVIVGTAAYMSPEQAHGKAADRRADIWSFGVVLFEMLTGQSAFCGESVSGTLAAVLTSEVDWQALPTETPAAVRTLLRRCLAKDRKQRLQAIGDARIVLEECLLDPGQGRPKAPEVLPARRWLPWGIVAGLAVALVGGGIAVERDRSVAAASIRASILAPDDTEFRLQSGGPGTPVISPDGSKITFTATRHAQWLLWVRELDKLEARALPGTEGAQYPFWSPDSKWIGYFSNQGKLAKIEASGGLPIAITDATDGKGGSWNRDDIIVFTPNANQPIFRVPASGGTPVAITRLDSAQGENSHREPEFLPDGRHFLFVARGSSVSGAAGRGAAIRIGSLDGQRSKVLAPTESQAIFSSGKLLFVQSGNLVARSFDPEKLEFTGDPVTVARDILSMENAFRSAFSASGNSRLIYMAGQSRDYAFSWLDRSGRFVEAVPGIRSSSNAVELAPDLHRIAVVDGSGRTTETVSIIDLARGVATHFTLDASAFSPVWLPDGRSLVFSSNRGGNVDLYWKPAGGGSDEQVLHRSDEDKYAVASSPDGRSVAYIVLPPHPNAGYWFVPLDGASPPVAGKPVQLARGATDNGSGTFSPDGKWFAYTMKESSAEDVYVVSVAGRDRRFQISAAGGAYPRWRRAGKELFYLAADGKMMSVDIDARGDLLRIGVPRPLFDVKQWAADFAFDVTPDGKRFLLETPVQGSSRMSLTLVTDWTAGIRK